MLVLSRKVGERIYLYPKKGTEKMTVEEFFAGGDICIEITSIKTSEASIGIDASLNLDIVREEIHE
jgi:sRNA-binding carbon storage regulator CsrA